MQTKEIYKKALQHWGIELQVGMLMEEMAELTIAVNKYRRNPNKITKGMLVEEMADVKIMLEQIEVVFDIPQSQKTYWRNHKLYKLEKLLKENTK